MNNIAFQIIFGLATVYFGALALRILPTLLRVLAALLTGKVKWPGPRVHDPDPDASVVRERLGVGYQNLFPAFLGNAATVVAGFGYTLFMFLASMPLLRDHIAFKSPWTMLILGLVAFAAVRIAFTKALGTAGQVDTLLADLGSKQEPRSVAGQSAEAEYAIEHSLLGPQAPRSAKTRALDLFYESVICHQEGNEARAMALDREALSSDPLFHEHARAALSGMAQSCSDEEAGAIYYWLGIHSESLHDWKAARDSYEKAIAAFNRIGYHKRESRACCNLGHVKMQTHDPTAMEDFEKAIALNFRNGTAHLNIATIYYGISGPGDERYEHALDAFADAILADPVRYGPCVIARLRSIGYTWREDLEDITQRVEKRRGK